MSPFFPTARRNSRCPSARDTYSLLRCISFRLLLSSLSRPPAVLYVYISHPPNFAVSRPSCCVNPTPQIRVLVSPRPRRDIRRRVLGEKARKGHKVGT
jgi:hypothetical protein